MTIELCIAAEAALDVDTTAAAADDPRTAAISMVESVAGVVAGIAIIGQAQRALHAAGWTATIAANRITVDDAVVVQLVPARMGTFGLVSASWVITSLAGTTPVWIVGTGNTNRAGVS